MIRFFFLRKIIKFDKLHNVTFFWSVDLCVNNKTLATKKKLTGNDDAADDKPILDYSKPKLQTIRDFVLSAASNLLMCFFLHES